MRIDEVIPVHCDTMPREMEDGKIYISKKYRVAIHLCACGCGGKAVTPLGQWELTESDDKVTLRPSIGNWSGEKTYHAHYFITNNKIEWC